MATMMIAPPRSSRSGDDDAFEALRAGDEGRFVEFAALHEPLISRPARSLTATAQEAGELMCMAWTDLLCDLDAIDEGWTLRTALIRRLVGRIPAWRHSDANMTVSDVNRPPDPLSAALTSPAAGPFMVVSLRDVEGWSAGEVSRTLGLSPCDQRRLLHQGRSAIHRALHGGPTAGATS